MAPRSFGSVTAPRSEEVPPAAAPARLFLLLAALATAPVVATPILQWPNGPDAEGRAHLEMPQDAVATGATLDGIYQDLLPPTLTDRWTVQGEENGGDWVSGSGDGGPESSPARDWTFRDLARLYVTARRPGPGIDADMDDTPATLDHTGSAPRHGRPAPGLLDLFLDTPLGNELLGVVLDIFQPSVAPDEQVHFSIFGYGDFFLARGSSGLRLLETDDSQAISSVASLTSWVEPEPWSESSLPGPSESSSRSAQPITVLTPLQLLKYLMDQLIGFLARPLTVIVLPPLLLGLIMVQLAMRQRQ
jgi:hypothetical protein